MGEPYLLHYGFCSTFVFVRLAINDGSDDSGVCSKRTLSCADHSMDIHQIWSTGTTRIGAETFLPSERKHGEPGAHDNMSSHARMHHGSSDRPMFATITIAVCHCGAGCLLGDVVGEWLVYGAGISINRRSLWAEYLIDYGFALLFGIIFQYFSIAPMSGEWGPKTIWRAAKADFLSLTFFEIGLLGWMAISQTAIFEWQLRMDNVVYWWMMQIGMFLGHWTAFPINYWLIKTGVKESCA